MVQLGSMRLKGIFFGEVQWNDCKKTGGNNIRPAEPSVTKSRVVVNGLYRENTSECHSHMVEVQYNLRLKARQTEVRDVTRHATNLQWEVGLCDIDHWLAVMRIKIQQLLICQTGKNYIFTSFWSKLIMMTHFQLIMKNDITIHTKGSCTQKVLGFVGILRCFMCKGATIKWFYLTFNTITPPVCDGLSKSGASFVVRTAQTILFIFNQPYWPF